MSTIHAPLEETLDAFDRAWTNASMGGFSSGSLAVDAAGMGERALVTAASALGSHQRALDAPRIAMAGEIAHRSQLSLGTEGMARKAGHARPAQYLAELWKITVGEAIRLCEVGLATRARAAIDGTPLPARYPVIAVAIAEGTLGVDSAAVIVKELEAASIRCSVEARVAGETVLVSLAASHSVADLRGLARQVRDRLDEDGAEPRDELHHKNRACRFIPLADGMLRLQWDMPPEVAALVKAGIDSCVSQALRRAKDERTEVRRGTGSDDKAGTCDEMLGEDGRSLDQLRSDAAEQIFHHVASCAGHGGDIPVITMVIRMSVDALTTGLGIAEIDGVDETISAGTARRMAGEAGIIPAVLGGPSEVLDFGKTRRLFSPAQKLAFGERDGGCAFGGCQAPPSYTEAHHIIWWSDVENTDLDNGILLCGFHHHRIHDGGWEIGFQHGVPYFIPPPWVDPGRTPRRGGKVTLDSAA